MRIETIYDVGDLVTIDSDPTIKGVVLAVNIRGTGKNITYDVSWFHNGQCCSSWIEEWRLDRWDA